MKVRAYTKLMTRLAFGLLGGTVIFAGCTDEAPACYDAEYAACSCAEAEGYQRCNDGVLAACVCDGTTPGLDASGGQQALGGGGSSLGGAGGAGGAVASLLEFLEPCDNNEQCETGLCHTFNAKGPHCTQSCDAKTPCPPPSPGCNNKGICKAP